MRKFVLLGFIVVFAFSLFAQQQKHEVSVINIEVPVRVFDGDNFVANLTLEDFELFEDGRPQKVEAVYLVRKTSIERAQENQKFFPAVSRYFVLLFEMSEYVSEIGKALDYFFENVISREDSLTVITPMKTYSLKSQAFKLRPAEEIAEQMKGIVRRDIEAGGSEYRNAIQELKMSLVDDDYPLDQKLQIYSSLLQRLENLRNVDQKKLVDFANFLKGKEGQKFVFLFYQKELIPKLSPSLTMQFTSEYQERPDIQLTLSDLFHFFKREVSFNVNLIKQAYSDSSISTHFLMLTKTKYAESEVSNMRPSDDVKAARYSSGVRMEESTEDIFSAFREVALATGGSVNSSANADYLIKKAVEASENYYLLYYSPENVKKNRKFRKIEVRVKKEGLRVNFRAGYIAD